MSDLIDGLPADPREALLGLIGSTFSELKRIDNHLVTRNNYVAGIKTDLNQLVSQAATLGTSTPQPQHPQPVPQLVPQIAHNVTPIIEPQIIQQPQIVEHKREDDDGQLLLDFYRKITPEDINSRLADIDIKLSKVIELLHDITNRK